jgi:type II secretory pathway pseudopilin PulG
VHLLEVKLNKKKKKQPITLIEIMIVILLIGLIGGVLAYNLKGSLDEGKVFKTEQGAQQVRNILLLEVAKGRISMADIPANWKAIIKASPLVGKPDDLIKDGWGDEFSVKLNNAGDDIIVESTKHLQLGGSSKG